MALVRKHKLLKTMAQQQTRFKIGYAELILERRLLSMAEIWLRYQIIYLTMLPRQILNPDVFSAYRRFITSQIFYDAPVIFLNKSTY